MTGDHELFRQGVRAFLEHEVVPHHRIWTEQGLVDKELFVRAGAAGYLAFDAPGKFGGGGVPDFRLNAMFIEEAAGLGVMGSVAGLSLHNDVCLPYLLEGADEDQLAEWLPGVCAGTRVLALAITEPDCGSDIGGIRTTARRDGGDFVVNGAKTFITNGLNCDLVILACRTDAMKRHDGLTLLLVEADSPGFRRGRKLDKIGLRASDTAELFFDDLRVPARNVLGEPNGGFGQMVTKLPRERLAIAVLAVAQAEVAFGLGLTYARERTAFGSPIGSFQHNRFALAEMRTEIDIARVFVDHQIDALNRRTLSAETAAEAKWWATELCQRVVDRCLQLHGGNGYMEEFSIAALWRDVRVLTIFGGTTQIMKELIGRSLGV